MTTGGPRPSDAEVARVLRRAIAHQQAGRGVEAMHLYRAILSARPDNGAALHNLAVVLRRRGASAAAVPLCRAVLALDPAADLSLGVLGRCLHELDPVAPDGVVALHRAATIAPATTDHWTGLAETLRLRRRLHEAERAAQRTCLLAPADVGGLANLANALDQLGRPFEAARVFRRALRRTPDSVVALGNLANALTTIGLIEPAQDARRAALVLDPGLSGIHSAYIFALDFDPDADVAAVQRMCRTWCAAHVGGRADHQDSVAAPPGRNDARADRRLRIGYVSADLRGHSAALGFAGLILGRDDRHFDVYCYSTTRHEDERSAQLRSRATGWRRVAGLGDVALSDRIRADAIDILVDLSGHTSGNRLGAFARRPAPIQVSVMGTGLPEIDYVVSDPVLIRPDERRHYRERVVYLEHDGAFTAFNAYAGPEQPAVAPLPMGAGRGPTFGCFNRLAKISGPALAGWAEILAARPDARLVVKARELDDPQTRAWFSERLARGGLAGERVVLEGGSTYHDHLAAHAAIDLMLDPFPYGGGISALDALWMGVPVLTLTGAKPSGRAASAIARAIGLDDFVATSPADYVARALDRLARPDALAALRTGLRARMKASPIGDPRLYAAAFERLYRRMWIAHCAGGPAEPGGPAAP